MTRLPLRSVALAVCALAGLSLSVATERASIERANRLHRSGELGPAADLYRERTADDTTASRLNYNLGTTLLRLGSASAESELARAAGADDERVRGSAHYNLGTWALGHALDETTPDSLRAHASRAVAHNREALRVTPGRPEARWNLELAQRLLDSIDAAEGRAGPESAEGSAESDRRALDDDLRELDDAAESSDAPPRGADEAPADRSGSEALARAEADAVLASRRSEPSVLLGKLLSFEGRFRPPLRSGSTLPRW
jgi:hypothetical protein